MYHLIYSSYASHYYYEEQLFELLDKCRTSNKKKNITGMLLYLNGKFIQVLEGDKEVVESLFLKISTDPHHEKVTLIVEGNSPERIFKDWSMGFKSLSDQEFYELNGFKNIENFFEKQPLTENSSMALIFLKLFYDKNIIDYPEWIDR
jgi:hypothetical protein